MALAGAPQTFSDDLSLDWTGLRNSLRAGGFDIRVGYISETASNVQGGDKSLWRYADQWTFAATLDLDKIAGLDQAQFKIVVTDRNGRSLSADAHLDDLQQVQEVYGNNETWYWTEFWYDQKFMDGTVDWKAGRLTGGEDFAAFSCEFLNLAFCGASPGNIAGNYWYSWPVSQWATRVKIKTSFGNLLLGAFEVNPNFLLTKYALDPADPPGSSGVLVPTEVGWLPTFGRGRDGSFKFGAWYNSSKAPDVVENANRQPMAIEGGTPLMRRGEYGAYFNFLQSLIGRAAGNSPKDLRFFINGIYADRRTSFVDSQMAAGILYHAPFASRPADEVGLAVGRTHVNSRVAQAEASEGVAEQSLTGIQRVEHVNEIFYELRLSTWLSLRPDIQYIQDPGGSAGNADELVLGLRVSVNF